MEEEIEDNDMNEEVEYSFTAYEIDLDYEFDAARFFDFSRAESAWEERQAELWFDTGGSYPPSPFMARLVPRKETLMENVNTSPKPKYVENLNLLESDFDTEADQEISAVDRNDDDGQDRGTFTNSQIGSVQIFWNLSHKLPSGLTLYNHTMNNNGSKTQTKLSMKPSFQRISTLMKPTASQLAKQNLPHQAGDSRSNKSFVGKTENKSGNSRGIESQAAKRQKLEGGHLRKVVGAEQQNNFVHKAHKQNGTIGNATQTKLRLTIPREPDLETTNRAQRIRTKTSKEPENVTSTVRRFKALPLNRKILEAPSLLLPKRSTPHLPEFQEFHLMTSERAMQHTAADPTSTAPLHPSDKLQGLQKSSTTSTIKCGNRDLRRLNVSSATRQEGFEPSYCFKAFPLNKKILSSRGDIGVSINSKKETTVPMEFNFQMEKRFHHNPPVELFNKLSLASLNSSITGSVSTFPLSTCISAKDSKEKRWGSIQQEHKQVVIRNKSRLGVRQIQHSTDEGKSSISPLWN